MGFRIAAKDPDEDHPYGHQRFEYISGLFISILLLFVGLQFLQSSFKKILKPESVKISTLVFIVLGISILVKLWQNLFYKRVGQHIDSQTLVAAAKDSFMDILTTAAILISAMIYQIWHLNIDGWVGLLIAIYITVSGFMMLRGFINQLLGDRPSAHEVDGMTKELEQFHEVLGFHDLLIHSYGPNAIFATVDVEFDSRWRLDQAHEVINDIERDFKQRLDVTLVCHVDPIDLDNRHYNEVHEAIKRIIKAYGMDLHTHDFHVEQTTSGEIVQFDIVVPEEIDATDSEIQRQITLDLKQEFPNMSTEINFDHHYIGEDHSTFD